MKKNLLSIGVVCLSMLILSACGNNQQEKTISSLKRENTELKKELKKYKKSSKEDILSGWVKIPDPYFKSKDEVAELFKAAGVKAKFVVTNFDQAAIVNKRYLHAGECNQLSYDQSNVKYFNTDEVKLEKAGLYAKKGSTVIVGYTDHNFDGTKGDSNTTNQSTTQSNSTTTQKTSNKSVFANQKAPKTGNADLDKQIEEVGKQYDELIKRAKEFNNNPTAYTDEAALQLTQDVTTMATNHADISEKISDLDASKTIKIETFLQNKNIDLLEEINKLPNK